MRILLLENASKQHTRVHIREQTQIPAPYYWIVTLSTLHPTPYPLHPTPYTLNPKKWIHQETAQAATNSI